MQRPDEPSGEAAHPLGDALRLPHQALLAGAGEIGVDEAKARAKSTLASVLVLPQDTPAS